jgi:hypothetical protein
LSTGNLDRSLKADLDWRYVGITLLQQQLTPQPVYLGLPPSFTAATRTPGGVAPGVPAPRLNSAPHLPQKFAAGGFSAPHVAQSAANPFPHCAQKLLPAGFFIPHLEQRIGSPQRIGDLAPRIAPAAAATTVPARVWRPVGGAMRIERPFPDARFTRLRKAEIFPQNIMVKYFIIWAELFGDYAVFD